MSMCSQGRGVTAACIAAVCGAPLALAEIHEVQQMGKEFIPREISVTPGDTVRWIWNDGFHTVTSGENCEFDGLYFNEPLWSNNPIVDWDVPEDFSGDVPYLCTPHCGVDMVGMISVEITPDCPGDIDNSGDVDFDDLLVVLSGYGPCPKKGECPGDIDDSGDVDFDDLLVVLSNYGPCE